MPEPTPSSIQVQDLTTAISRLLPAIQSLETLLAEATQEATEHQQKLAEMMERLTRALEGLETHQGQIAHQLSQNSRMMATVQNSVKDLTHDLPKEAQGRLELKAQIAVLTALLRGPA
jgi:ABC-type transporter Mla subunit MlaD